MKNSGLETWGKWRVCETETVEAEEQEVTLSCGVNCARMVRQKSET